MRFHFQRPIKTIMNLHAQKARTEFRFQLDPSYFERPRQLSDAHPLIAPKDLLEYVIVHEMAHLMEPTHNDRFIVILEEHYPTWRDARVELNDLPLTAEMWKE